jgi:hypothetical protein
MAPALRSEERIEVRGGCLRSHSYKACLEEGLSQDCPLTPSPLPEGEREQDASVLVEISIP